MNVLGARETEIQKKGSLLSYIHFPPWTVCFKTATCGFLLVQADRQYHFIKSSTFLPLPRLTLSTFLRLLRPAQKQLCDSVQYDTVQLSIQHSRLT